MAGVAVTTQGNLGTSTKQENGALLRIGPALCGLVGSLISSLEESRDVENTLKLEVAAWDVDGSPDESQVNVGVKERPELLLIVAGALKEIVGTLVSDIKGSAEVQKLVPAIQKSCGLNEHALDDLVQDLKISRHSSDDLPPRFVGISPGREDMLISVSSKDLRMAKRAAVKDQKICMHSCEAHPELVDPGLWSNYLKNWWRWSSQNYFCPVSVRASGLGLQCQSRRQNTAQILQNRRY